MTLYAGQYGPETLTDTTGRPAPTAQVQLYLPGTSTAATLYGSHDRSVPLAANPLPSGVPVNNPGLDIYGNLMFFADPAKYDLVTTVSGHTIRQTITVNEDPAEPEAGSGAGTVGLAGPAPFNPPTTWDSSVTYHALSGLTPADSVNYNGTWYGAVATSMGIAPGSDPTKWAVLSTGASAQLTAAVTDLQNRVAALEAVVNTPASPTGLPVAPVLTATGGNDAGRGFISASWNAVPGATSYQLLINGISAGPVVAGTSTVATGLTLGISYGVSVEAVNSVGTGPPSNVVSVTPSASTTTAAAGIVQKASGSGDAVTTLSTPWPAAPTVGSLLIAVLSGEIPSGTPSVSMTSTGWTLVPGGPAPYYTDLKMYTKRAVAAEPAVVSGLASSGAIVVELFEIAAATATMVDQAASWSSNGIDFTSSTTGTTGTTSAPSDLVIAAWAFTGDDAAPTYSAGYTQASSTAIVYSQRLAIATLQTTTAGPQQATATLPASGQGGTVAMIATFNAGPVGGSPGTGATGTNPIATTARSGLSWLSGVYPTGLADGNYLTRTQSFEDGRGKLTDIVEGTEPDGTWGDLTNGYVFGAYAGYPGTLVISTAMIPADGSTIAAGASGAYDQHWRDYGTMMVNRGRGKSVLRVGWEFDGSWYRWAASNPTDWLAYWKRIYTAIKTTNPQAIICWNGEVGAPQCGGGVTNQFTQLYPGDAYVDLLGFDVYDMYDKQVRNDTDWANVLRLHGQGLDDWMDFAKAHGKKCCIPEWGCETNATDTVNKGGDNPFFVTKMLGWIRANAADIGFESYFNEQASYIANSLFDPQQMPNAAAAYKSGLYS